MALIKEPDVSGETAPKPVAIGWKSSDITVVFLAFSYHDPGLVRTT